MVIPPFVALWVVSMALGLTSVASLSAGGHGPDEPVAVRRIDRVRSVVASAALRLARAPQWIEPGEARAPLLRRPDRVAMAASAPTPVKRPGDAGSLPAVELEDQ